MNEKLTSKTARRRALQIEGYPGVPVPIAALAEIARAHDPAIMRARLKDFADGAVIPLSYLRSCPGQSDAALSAAVATVMSRLANTAKAAERKRLAKTRKDEIDPLRSPARA